VHIENGGKNNKRKRQLPFYSSLVQYSICDEMEIMLLMIMMIEKLDT
jgi:hypothetical protein